MIELTLPKVGFDRFIAYPWIEYALDLAISEPNDAERRNVLKNWLQTQISGAEAARKTYNLLARIWFVEYPETAFLRAEALRIVPDVNPQERIALHWGMCLANFHLFSDTVANAGRLIRLQGECTLLAVQQRLAEMYSNQGTIPRSAARVFQSLRDWQIITQQADGHYASVAPTAIEHPDLLSFLVACALQHKNRQAATLTDVIRLPELFPFELTQMGAQALKSSLLMDFHREGSNQEMIVLKQDRR